MTGYQKTARLVGIFYIAATAAGIIGISLTQSTLDASDYLVQISSHENQMRTGALFELIMAVAVVGIAVTVYPVLKKHNASIAVSYVSARLVEGVTFILSTLSLLLLLTLSQELADAGTPDPSYFHTSGELLLAVRDWSGHVILDIAVFPLGALLFYSLLYRTRLVPRWLSGVGIVGAVLYWSASVLVLFDLVEPLSSPYIALQAPLGLQEMVLALWLIVKGFNASALASASAQTAPKDF
jgi:hypothetical protein